MDLKIERRMEAPIIDVYEAWSESDAVAQWLAPQGYATEIHVFNFREGGQYRLVMRDEDEGDEYTLRGTFKEIIPSQKIVLTWRWEHDDADTLVTVLFEEDGVQTDLTILHNGFADEESRQMHRAIWESVLDNLAQMLATTGPVDIP